MSKFDPDLISDMHKEAYGFRPYASFINDWVNSNDIEKQEMWDRVMKDVALSIKEQANEL